MNTDDPLSDDACFEAMLATGKRIYIHSYELGWQEARRRATDRINYLEELLGNLEDSCKGYGTENKRLRGALESITLPPLEANKNPFTQTIENYGRMLDIARAALGEGILRPIKDEDEKPIPL